MPGTTKGTLLLRANEFDIPNPDPNRHYVWINGLNRDQWITYTSAGYEPVVGEDEAAKLFGKERAKYMLDGAGRVSIREMVLLSTSASNYDEYRRALAAERAELLDRPVDRAHAEIEQIGPGIKAFVTSKEEYVDRKKFDTREGKPVVGYTGKPKR